jgi:hypothetical protein
VSSPHSDSAGTSADFWDRDGTTSHQLAPLKKSIYSLFDFRQLAAAANRRTLALLSALDAPTVSVGSLGRLSQKRTNADLRKHLPGKSPGQVSRMLKRLWTRGLIKKVGGTYRYTITDLGRTLITMELKLKNLVLIPELARTLAA